MSSLFLIFDYYGLVTITKYINYGPGWGGLDSGCDIFMNLHAAAIQRVVQNTPGDIGFFLNMLFFYTSFFLLHFTFF